MRVMVFFLLIFFFAFYMACRTAFVFGIGWKWLFAGLSVLAVASIFAMFAVRNQLLGWHILAVVLSSVAGVLLYMLISISLTDLINIFTHFSPKTYGLIVASATILLSAYGLVNASIPRLRTVEVEMPKLTQPVQLVQFSDVHLGHFRGKRNLQRLVDIANSTDAKALMITGDLFESLYNLNSATLEPLNKLKMPVYFVIGNHDTYVNADSVKKLMRLQGVNVLENEAKDFGELQIVGLEYMRPDDKSSDHMHASFGNRTIENTLSAIAIDSTRPSILLHHNPVGAEYASKAGIGLYLAGHTHGGQLFPMTIINNYAFKYNRGLYRFEDTQVYTSVGSGTFGPPMRVGTPSEVTLVKLIPAK